MTATFWQAVKGRRSLYSLGDSRPIDEKRVEEIVRDALRYVPSAFDSRSTRIVLLFGDAHRRLWTIVLEALEKKTSPEKFAGAQKKVLRDFAAGWGTVLFLENTAITEELSAKFPSYADRFPDWGHHTNAMHQYVVWTALEAEGLAASLQHYNPLIDGAVAREWNLPASWRLLAQMPFGSPGAPAAERSFGEPDDRLQVFY